MKKNFVTLIIALLSCCLAGIIAFQVYWLVSAYDIKEEQFDRSVFAAMNDISDKLEATETITAATSRVDEEDTDEDDVFEGNFDFSFDNFSHDSLFESLHDLKQLGETIQSNFQANPAGIQISITADDDSTHLQICNNALKVITKNKKGHGMRFIKKNKTAVFDKSKVIDRKKWVEKLMKYMVFNIKTKDLPVEKRIQDKNLKAIIGKELGNHGVLLPFEYAVSKNEPEKGLSLKSEKFSPQMLSGKYKIPLFRKDLLQRTELLVIAFPGKNKFIMSSISVTLFVQILFTMIIIMVFAGTIFFIIRQKRISDMKNDFISNMTHEFKTPIATINLAVDSMNNPKVMENKEMVQNLTKVIKEENSRMNARVENILQIAMMDKHEPELNFVPVDIHEILDFAVEKLRFQVESRNGSVTALYEAELSGIKADKEHISNAMINIIDNANKYSHEKPVIIIKTRNENGCIKVTVSDNGIGMSREVQNKIFDKFYRASTGNIHNVKGFGIGLSYVKAIIEAHRGTIIVKSEPGKGSIFEITLPVFITS